MRLAGHVASIGERRGAYRTLVGKPEEYRPMGRQSEGVRIILKWIIRQCDERVCAGPIWLRIATGGGLL
jgi:hypothetical protein